ncbi:MAG: acetylxylan esterase, partial [Planctomycetes bacterium]|nr:acetylxylan esterase [Planctomycetota bacterium]
MSNNSVSPTRTRRLALLAVFVGLGFAAFVPIQAEPAEAPEQETGDGLNSAEMLIEYYDEMSSPKPFLVRGPQEFADHRRRLKEEVLESVGLSPLPERIPLDVHESEPLDHPWCTVRRVYYQLWPGVYSTALLYMPKTLPQRPAPAMLSAHGHWKDGNAHPEVQKRCLNFARLGYVTLASTQNHYEDLYCGVSHQTLMIWTNMRAIDYLESLPEVDKNRIGAAGASGGGLQTQMVAALDTRVKAATVVGLTCDFRRIMFPERHHCTCNHFPRVMQFTDHPEISALALPTPLQFLTMNDWTRQFEEENLPTLEALYAANGFPDRIDCSYYDTPHSYDREKRERTYGWMERWVRGGESAEPVAEPDDVETFPVDTLAALSVDVPADKGFDEIGRIYRRERGYETPTLDTPAQWSAYRDEMLGHLRHLLGEQAVLPRRAAEPRMLSTDTHRGLLVEHVAYPSEGGILVPTIVLRSRSPGGKQPVVVFCGEPDRQAMLELEGPDSPTVRAQQGALVAIPDVRCYGQL